MPIVLETAVATYLNGSQPSITAVASRAAQTQTYVLTRVQHPLPRPTVALITEDGPTVSIDNPLPEATKSAADLAVSQLILFEEFGADWDGNGAAKPINETLKDARSFVRSLSAESVIPRATLHADGHAILFVRGTDLHGEIEFLGGNKIGFYVRRGKDEWIDEIFFDGKSLPEGLSQIGFAL
jgi:hypothetical protein